MNRKTINAKEILADIKAGMDDAALMQKYGLSEKGLQSLFKKLKDAGVLKQREPEERTWLPEPRQSGTAFLKHALENIPRAYRIRVKSWSGPMRAFESW